jgi:isopropylmalate/homocitrate/citramalate synthase
LVQEITGIAVQLYKPLVGTSVFLETPDTHIEGILRARINGERTRGFIEPCTIGQKMTLLFGPSALGGKSIELKAEGMGITLNGEQVRAVVSAILLKSQLFQLIFRRENEHENSDTNVCFTDAGCTHNDLGAKLPG